MKRRLQPTSPPRHADCALGLLRLSLGLLWAGPPRAAAFGDPVDSGIDAAAHRLFQKHPHDHVDQLIGVHRPLSRMMCPWNTSKSCQNMDAPAVSLRKARFVPLPPRVRPRLRRIAACRAAAGSPAGPPGAVP